MEQSIEELNNLASSYQNILSQIFIEKFEKIRTKYNFPEIKNISYEVPNSYSLYNFLSITITTITERTLEFQMSNGTHSNYSSFNFFDKWTPKSTNLTVNIKDKKKYDNNIIPKQIFKNMTPNNKKYNDNDSDDECLFNDAYDYEDYDETQKQEIDKQVKEFRKYVETGIYFAENERKIFLSELEGYLTDVRHFLLRLKLT
jgi:hypothetical protein